MSVVKTIHVEDLKELQSSNTEYLLLDVREPDEFDEFNLGGHLLPLGDLLSGLDEIESWKDRKLVVHCRSGKRSVAACEVLSQLGFNEVYNLEGGVMAWVERYGM
jgi:rhodanese-related sulfurtransferase